jgi:Helix-turn-helix domain
MNTTIDLSLPKEQLDLLREIHAQQKILIDTANAAAWLDDDALCVRFGVGKTTLRRWREDEALPFCQIGDKRLYAPKLVDEWMLGHSPQNVLVYGSKINLQKVA